MRMAEIRVRDLKDGSSRLERWEQYVCVCDMKDGSSGHERSEWSMKRVCVCVCARARACVCTYMDSTALVVLPQTN